MQNFTIMPKPEEYLESISEIVNSFGVRGLTMEQIASKIGITKRTLYNNFGTKEELVKAIIDFKFLKMRETVLELASHPNKNAINIHLSVMWFSTRHRDESSLLFLKTLRENYPELFEYMTHKSQRMMNEFFALNIPRGRSEGLYRTDFDIDIIASFAYMSINNFIDSFLSNDISSMEKEKMRSQVVTLLLRGMVTLEGGRVLEDELRMYRQ